MHEYIPLFGAISNDRGRFTLYYKEQRPYCDSHCTGYHIGVFDECKPNTPIVRFDIATFDNVCRWLRANIYCMDYNSSTSREGSGWTSLPLAEYLAKFAEFDIPIMSLEDTIASVK